MAGFRKARAEQAALKISMYGPPGTGKTCSALLIAEGLARLTSTRIAYVDTERGTDFYAVANPAREFHPDAFDFDALYSRSLTEVLAEVQSLSPRDYGVVVIDSISHLWDAAIAGYTGYKTRAGTIPMQAWSKIKAPYKALMQHLINSTQHVLILGRQKNLFEDDENTGESKAAGVAMRAEGETQYEPHVCLRMEALRVRGKKGQVVGHATAVIAAFAEKDRSSTLHGRVIEWPSYDNVAVPLLGLLGNRQAQVQSDLQAASIDQEVLAQQERERAVASCSLRDTLKARLALTRTEKEVKVLGTQITADVKRRMLPEHVAELRGAYLEAEQRVQGKAVLPPPSTSHEAEEDSDSPNP